MTRPLTPCVHGAYVHPIKYGTDRSPGSSDYVPGLGRTDSHNEPTSGCAAHRA